MNAISPIGGHGPDQWRPGGRVYFIGSGCGDPELLSLKAHRLLQSAQVILYDALVSPELQRYFPLESEQIYVGKRAGQHSMAQAEIGQLMLDKARQGLMVVRLKGGDPSVFARLAEETDILQARQIPFAVVPGITAASGCAAYSGIPLTHRDCAQSVKFVTASRQRDGLEHDWPYLAQEPGSLVFYMGLSKIAYIASQLMANGMGADTPIAVIDRGSMADQQVISSQLRYIEQELRLAELQGPAVIIVGQVVARRATPDLTLLAENYQQSQALLSLVSP